MSYSNPDILIIENPIGLDAVIQSYQQDLYAGLPWLTKSFGRAREFREGGIKTPKCYMGLGEYYNVLPNDFLQAQSFIIAREREQWPGYSSGFALGGLERELSLIFWCNLNWINPAKDYIFTEELRWEVEKIIKANPFTKAIQAFYDDRIEDVFMGYVGENHGIDGATDRPYLMYPYAGFRFDVMASYPEHADCLTWSSGFNSELYFMDDIDFQVSGDLVGKTVYQDDRLKGKKVRLVREGLKQHIQQTEGSWYWSFNSATGTITVNPAWYDKERVKIEIYGFQK